MVQINEMCGPKWGHKDWADQTECRLTVMRNSDNPDLVPSNPYIGWYTAMARKMIDDVKAGRTSEGAAIENCEQAYHEVMLRQQQAVVDQLDRETAERHRFAAQTAFDQAAAEQRQAYYQEQDEAAYQARMDRFCFAASKSVDDTCSVQTKNPKVSIGLCVAAKILYAQQGCI